MAEDEDGRLTGQEKYLRGVTLTWRSWSTDRPDWDHDHCEFCWVHFGDHLLRMIPTPSLRAGSPPMASTGSVEPASPISASDSVGDSSTRVLLAGDMYHVRYGSDRTVLVGRHGIDPVVRITPLDRRGTSPPQRLPRCRCQGPAGCHSRQQGCSVFPVQRRCSCGIRDDRPSRTHPHRDRCWRKRQGRTPWSTGSERGRPSR